MIRKLKHILLSGYNMEYYTIIFCPITSNLTRIVVPTANRAAVLQMYHEDPTSSHFGVYKTLRRVTEVYYWSGVCRSVYQYVRKCPTCAASNSLNLPQVDLMGS